MKWSQLTLWLKSPVLRELPTTLEIKCLKFTQEVKEEDMPPFPSVPTYDAKAWKIMREQAKPGSLFWNVGK